jgi:predicted Zn finger-like uncharacterized protein
MEEATATKLVHSLKKEAPKPDAARTPLKTAAQPERSPDVLTLTCARCNKRYKIDSQKIPPTAKSLKCQACGHRIKLPVPEVTPIQQIPTPVNLPPTLSRPRKKMRLYAMAAGILLLLMAGAFAGFKIYKDRGPAGTQEQLAASSALLRQEPFLALNLNLPLILNNIDQRVAKDKKTLKFRTTMSLGTARIQFSLSLPDALQIFEFKSGVEKGSQKTSGGIQGARDISYRLEKGRLANVSAAFGIVQLNIRTDIKRLSFAKKEGGNPQTRNLSSGEPVTVSFNKNEASYGAGKKEGSPHRR